MVSILSIDGGGIRGIIPATFLAEFEKRTGKPICTLFDLIAGTSTGGILAAALTLPNADGRPKYTAAEIKSAYFTYGGAIFRRGFFRKLRTLWGLAGPKYSPRTLKKMLEEYLGEARLHETLSEILVTAYDMTSSTPWFFKTSFAKEHPAPADDPLLTQVTLATSSAPTYFPPLSMEGHCMIDGGVFASNPALCAYAQARVLYPEENEFFVVSLGTGLNTQARACTEVEKWGVVRWAVPITGVMLNSSSATVDYQMRALSGRKNYVRFQVHLEDDMTAMDDASEKNMEKLDALALAAVERDGDTIDRVCRILNAQSSRAATYKLYSAAQVR